MRDSGAGSARAKSAVVLPALRLRECRSLSTQEIRGEMDSFLNSLGFGIVRVDDEVLEVPQSPAEVLKPLTLLEEAGYLCADLLRQRGECRG